ncbi:hypothetical protein COCCADRAFT_78417, partial [Bipolaris zeicola 26-R-13]
MDSFQENFEYLRVNRIAICKSHQQGIIRSQLQAHLDTKHLDLAPKTRRSIIEAAHTEEALRDWADDICRIVYPRPDAAPLPHLPVYVDGLQCTQCGFIYRNVKRMQQHCRSAHDWQSSRQRRAGRPGASHSMWTSNVLCQKLHNASTLGRLFPVQGAVPIEPDDGDDEEARLRQAFAAAATQIDQVVERKNPNNVIEDDSSQWGYQVWLNRAGWARHLGGLSREWLLDMAQTPRYHERALQDVCWAAEMVIWRAQQASHSSVVGMPAMMHINRREYGTTSNEKPFNASQTEPTMKKYRSVWLQVIAYIWRTYEL